MPEGRNSCQDTLEYAIQNDTETVKILRLIFLKSVLLLLARGFHVSESSCFLLKNPPCISQRKEECQTNQKHTMKAIRVFC